MYGMNELGSFLGICMNIHRFNELVKAVGLIHAVEELKYGKENPGRLLCLNNQSGNGAEINVKSMEILKKTTKNIS